jgi:L-seryl-tRNA(Ser) seleniumtransferase
MVVNNNAAAILLIMRALASGREAVISRGDLVEIGGSFRLTDVMTEGGVTLREVGASNHTRLDDYARAVVPGRTALLMKVHPSNFRLVGYCGQTSVADLAGLAGRCDIPLVYDLGSGSVADLSLAGLPDEPTVKSVLKDGADLVTMSGDKLLGAAQAGVIVGRKNLITPLRRHPLARALRIDKLNLAALEATLRQWLYREGEDRSIPAMAMLLCDSETLKSRAQRLSETIPRLKDLKLSLVEVQSQTGGGAGPEWPLPSWGLSVSFKGLSPDRLEGRLRLGKPPVVARIQRGELVLDVRTVLDGQLTQLAEALAVAVGSRGERR